jgi:hypothetical protein
MAVRQACIHGHEGWMKQYREWDKERGKAYLKWRCMECSRQSMERYARRRLVKE